MTDSPTDLYPARSIKYIWHDDDLTVLEGLLARGDRRLCKYIETVYKKGRIFDAWTDFFKRDVWFDTIKEMGIDLDFYNFRERGADEIFPWDFIDVGVTRKFLRREYEKALQGIITPNCRAGCAGCGAFDFHGGVCFEPGVRGKTR